MKHWHFGSYRVGYQPDGRFGGVYLTEDKAKAARLAAFESAWDSGNDEDFLEGHTQIHAGDLVVKGGDRYYEIYECGADECGASLIGSSESDWADGYWNGVEMS